MRLRNVWVVHSGSGARGLDRVRRRSNSNTSSEPASPAATPGPESRHGDRRRREGRGHDRRHAAPKNEPIKMNADPVCVKQNTDAAIPGDLRRRQRRQVARQRLRLRQGRPRHLRLRHADRDGEDRPEGLPLSPARVRHARGQPLEILNSDPTLHNIHALPKAEQGVQQRPADPGHEDDAHLHGEGSDGALQVRRARLDERLRRRAGSSVLRRPPRRTASST